MEELKAELERLHFEHARLLHIQEEMMAILECSSPDMLLHDLRNVKHQLVVLNKLFEKINTG